MTNETPQPAALPPDQPQAPGPSTPASAGAGPPTQRSRSWLLPVATGVGGFVLGIAVMAGAGAVQGVIGRLAEDNARAALLPDALEACGAEGTTGLDLVDEGMSLSFDMKGGDDATGASLLDIVCVFTELEMPSRISSHMDQTTSLDGRQSETWDGVTVSWSYHPDRGMDGVLTVEDE